jgi:hypothetical protein
MWPRLISGPVRKRKSLRQVASIAPSKGLSLRTERFTSSPDGNSVNIQFIRPTDGKILPCVYYIHGGGMATMSCYYGNYRAWGRMIAALAVAMVDFRNAVRTSTAPEVAPYPAGLNDCVSGLKWVHANAEKLGIDTNRMVASKIAPAAWFLRVTTATIPLLFGGERDAVPGMWINSRQGTIGAHRAGLPPVSLPLWEAVQ